MTVQSDIEFARRIVNVMDLRFRIFGVSFGIDPLLDIIPGFGNIVASLVSLYLFWIAYQLRVPARIYLLMLWNIGVDYLFGTVPIIGFVADLFFRANVKNLTLLESYISTPLEGEIVDSL